MVEQQFPSNVYAWRRLARTAGAELRVVAPPPSERHERGALWNVRLLESIDERSLVAINKRVNLPATRRGCRDAIRRIHDHGIAVVGGFMFGCEDDAPDIFDRTVEFVFENARQDLDA